MNIFVFGSSLADALSETISSALQINVYQMLIQIASTLILVVIVRVFFWKKITAFLERRKAYIEDEIKSAESFNQEAKQIKSDAELERRELLERSKEILDNAKVQGEAERQQIVENAKKEATRLMEAKKDELAMEQEKARAELKNEVIDLAVKMAEKIIQEEVDDKKYKDLSLTDLERSDRA